MKRLKVGLNGFGRIGRAFTRIAIDRGTFDIVAVNTRSTKPEMMAYLLKYDSVYRTYGREVTHSDDGITVGGKSITVMNGDRPDEIPWEKYGVDVVVDATGAFTKKPELVKHLRGSVKKVVLTAPGKDEETPHLVLGVNEAGFDFKGETVISNASCTTNCASPLFKVLDDNFGISVGYLTTAHAYTQTQSLLDDSGKSFDRARAAALNIVPSTTGATKAVVKTIPSLKGKIDGMAIRVPVPTVSFTDISAVVKKPTSVEEVNAAFQAAAQKAPLKGILAYERETLVSSDYIGSPYSAIFDSNYTKVTGKHFIKICGWYDNEWGYSTRLVDLVEKLANFF